MRKYWKSIVIIAVIVFGIGIYYVNTTMSASQYPEFVLEKQGGNEQEANPIILSGSYSTGSAGGQLQITAEGSTYKSEQSFLDQLTGLGRPLINRLQKEHRNFMRGKERNINAFYEDQKSLVYADVQYKLNVQTSGLLLNDLKFAISILDKESDETKNYEVEIPKSDKVDSMVVKDVQMINNNLKLITRNYARNGDEIHVYTFDIKAEKISNQKKIFSASSSEKSIDIMLSPVNESNSKQAHDTIVYAKIEMKKIQREDDLGNVVHQMEEKGQSFISYNLKTKETKKLDLPEGLEFQERNNVFDGSTIYFTEKSEEGLAVIPFYIENNNVGDKIKLENSNKKDEEGQSVIKIKDGKLYVLSTVVGYESKSVVTVIDLKSREKLYGGKILSKDLNKQFGEKKLYVFEMEIK